MARRRKQTKAAAPEPTTHVPPVRAAEPTSSPREIPPAQHRAVRVDAKTAAQLCDNFPAGGEAFAVWCQTQGIDTRIKRALDQWAPLLDEFATRSVFGLRRSQNGTHSAKR